MFGVGDVRTSPVNRRSQLGAQHTPGVAGTARDHEITPNAEIKARQHVSHDDPSFWRRSFLRSILERAMQSRTPNDSTNRSLTLCRVVLGIARIVFTSWVDFCGRSVLETDIVECAPLLEPQVRFRNRLKIGPKLVNVGRLRA